jgi:hypothetical protein
MRIIVATVGARIVGYYYVRSLEKKLEINREIIIKTNLKETTDSLFYLYQDIERLFKHHNLKDDEIFNQSPDDIKEFINKNILPPDDISWYPAQRAPEYQ